MSYADQYLRKSLVQHQPLNTELNGMDKRSTPALACNNKHSLDGRFGRDLSG